MRIKQKAKKNHFFLSFSNFFIYFCANLSLKGMTYNVILFSLRNMLRLDIMIWIAGIPLLVFAVMWLYYQLRLRKELQKELSLLSKVQRHSVEYDLVLKVMKMAIYRIDVQAQTITFESDFRDVVGSFHFSPNTPLEEFYELMLPESSAKIQRALRDLMEGRTDEAHEQFETRLPHSDQIHWEDAYATIEKRDLHGNPLMIVGTVTFIDKQKSIERELIEARNHAEESDRLKSAFLANMSHEIRTPLNAIVGFSDVLPMAQNDDERKELINLIKQNNARLLRLFDDMANMSKLEAGDEAVRKEHFNLNQLLMDVADKFADKSQETGVKIEIETPADVVQPYSDRNRLREILHQYMDNALKFTTEGVVTLGYQVNNGLLRIWVRDTGKGIPAKHCNDHLFERFVKVDEFVPGSGLGLSICRSMASSIGGKVGVESKLNVGSLFWVEIPME
jgi:signal transduction histidine kinase